MDRTEAHVGLINLYMNYHKSACLYVAAKLEVADCLANEERPIDEIAEVVNAKPDRLYRVMRLLASEGVFEERPGRVFAPTPMSDLLRVQEGARFTRLQ